MEKIYIFHPYSNIGGADLSISRIIRNLKIRDFDVDFIYLIDKYFGSLPAVFTYTIVKKIFESSEIYQDKNYRDMRKRLRDITIRLDRLEVLKSL